jgi:hypothetical protein
MPSSELEASYWTKTTCITKRDVSTDWALVCFCNIISETKRLIFVAVFIVRIMVTFFFVDIGFSHFPYCVISGSKII